MPKKDNCCLELKALVKLLIKKTDKLLENIGDLPATVPDNIASSKPKIIKIKSLAELALWQTKQLDGITGNYPIEIEIEDNDITKKGNQSLKLSLPNQAEAMAEMIGLLLTLKMESSATLSASVKAMIEAGGAKQAATIASDLGLANAEYLGYKLNKEKRDIGMSFTPGKTKLDEVLEPYTAQYITYENKDDKDIKDVIHPLLEMSARWNAQNYRHIGKGDNATDRLLQLLAFSPNSTGDVINKDKNADDDFDIWLESAEIGFTDKAKINKEKPFGEDRENRPKLINKEKREGNQ
jgi:hypothetical protein